MEKNKEQIISELKEMAAALKAQTAALEARIAALEELVQEEEAATRQQELARQEAARISGPIDIDIDIPVDTIPVSETDTPEPLSETVAPEGAYSLVSANAGVRVSDSQEEPAVADSPEEPTVADNQEEPAVDDVPEGQSINDAAKAAKSVNDRSATPHAWRTSLPGSPVRNILSAISLNDRVLFINTLFQEDPALFQSTIAQFNEMQTLEEAESYIEANFPGWNLDSDIAFRFMMAVRRKLQ